MTPEDLWWQDELSAMTQETIQFYEEKFAKAEEMVHPMLEMVEGEQKKIMAHRIQSAWRRVQEFINWEQFISISSIFLEMELAETVEVDNLTDNILAYIHFELDELGVEVDKIRNGMRVGSKRATEGIRKKVMDLIVNHELLNIPTKADIKLSLYTTLVG
jgi:hypothetical protein